MYYYDSFGWQTFIPNSERSVDAPPLTETGGMKNNWTGTGWVLATYSAPVAPTPTAARRVITTLAFRNRFTLAEKVTLEIASLDNPAAAMSVRQQAAALRASQADTNAATYIDLDRADTRAGVTSLETAGIIASGRALQILNAATTPIEVPPGF